jgi:hypothetical protein
MYTSGAIGAQREAHVNKRMEEWNSPAITSSIRPHSGECLSGPGYRDSSNEVSP